MGGIAPALCSLAAKALVAQQFGAVALLVSPALPSFRGMLGAEADDSAEGVRIPVVQGVEADGSVEGVRIPVVQISEADTADLGVWLEEYDVSEEDAADLGVWLEEYDVEALLESSERLAANDPSLTKAQREASPDGFHPENGGYWDEGGECGGEVSPDGFHPENGGYWDEGGECGVPYAQRFHMPGNGNGNFWYTYEYGSVTMVHISTEHDFTPGSPQHSWLEKTLGAVTTLSPQHDFTPGSPQHSWLEATLRAVDREATVWVVVDREATAWVVVAMHRSIYGRSMSQGNQNTSMILQIYGRSMSEGNQNTSMILQGYLEPLLKEHKVDVEYLEPLLKEHKVDVVLSGHEHRYLRTAPVWK
ncbi:Metallo-dependent phosphatase-like protein, partial [Baffinella frigidus]